MKRSPIVKRPPYSVSKVGSCSIFLLEKGQRPPDTRVVAPGDYYVTYDGFVFVRLETGRWSALHEDSIEREMALSVWKLKNEPPPTRLQF